jgi:hypothetical protein
VVRKGDLICVGISEVDSRINVNVEGGIDILDYRCAMNLRFCSDYRVD